MGWPESQLTVIRPLAETHTVYSNFDHDLDNEVVEILKANPNELCAQHAAWNFCGFIWFDGEMWWEEVRVYGSRAGTHSSNDLPMLIEHINNEYGHG